MPLRIVPTKEQKRKSEERKRKRTGGGGMDIGKPRKSKHLGGSMYMVSGEPITGGVDAKDYEHSLEYMDDSTTARSMETLKPKKKKKKKKELAGGGKVMNYRKGGKVRGAGIARQGVRKCKYV